MTIIGVTLALLFLEGLSRYLVIGGLLVIDVIQISVWLKWRKKKSITGAESLVGTSGVALTDLAPQGQVRLRGQIWKAHSKPPVAKGTEVEVMALDNMQLIVRPKREVAAGPNG